MRRFSTLGALAALMAVVACAARADPRPSAIIDQDVLASGFAELPADAREVVRRLAACSHFAGEFNGDGSDRDKQVTATMTELRCERIDADVEALRHKYASDPAIRRALTTASQF